MSKVLDDVQIIVMIKGSFKKSKHIVTYIIETAENLPVNLASLH